MFLDLPARAAKPRRHGLTHVLDKGLSVRAVDDLVEVAGAAVDIVKLGWGTALVTGNLEPKLAAYRAHAIPVVLGGTLLELALLQDRVDEYVAFARDLGIVHAEVSDGAIELPHADKLALIERLAADFTVLSEVGSKDAAHVMAPYLWVQRMQAELAAGAAMVIAEARESGTAGIARHDGELREGLVDEIAHAVPVERVIWEAPRKEQQVFLVRRFGPDVNLGNIAPADVLALETLRLGLRSDTVGAFG